MVYLSTRMAARSLIPVPLAPLSERWSGVTAMDEVVGVRTLGSSRLVPAYWCSEVKRFSVGKAPVSIEAADSY